MFELSLRDVQILRTGADGGHLYVRGYGLVPEHGEDEIYGYFADRADELSFERVFSGQSMIIHANTFECIRGMGTIVNTIISWQLHEAPDR
jgi:hypothetical protein